MAKEEVQEKCVDDKCVEDDDRVNLEKQEVSEYAKWMDNQSSEQTESMPLWRRLSSKFSSNETDPPFTRQREFHFLDNTVCTFAIQTRLCVPSHICMNMCCSRSDFVKTRWRHKSQDEEFQSEAKGIEDDTRNELDSLREEIR